MGEAADEADARREIARAQGRASVNWPAEAAQAGGVRRPGTAAGRRLGHPVAGLGHEAADDEAGADDRGRNDADREELVELLA